MSGKRIHLTVVDSTNSYTIQLIGQNDIENWTMVTASVQKQGRGQRGKSWQSNDSENLLSSIFFRPQIPLVSQFLISASSALLLVEFLQDYGIIAKVKWPNDVLVRGKKIAGLLIENQVQHDQVKSSVIGLGLNVNQILFDNFPWPVTSMKLESGVQFDLDEIANQWQLLLKSRMQEWLNRPSDLLLAFNHKLYGKSTQVSFDYRGELLTGLLVKVLQDGAIELKVQGETRRFYNGEIKLKRTSS